MNAHRVRLEPSALTVEPGREVTCTVRIINAGDVVDAFDVEVLGAAAAWTAVEPTTVSLFPAATGTARLTFRPARSPDVPAGPMPFAVRVQSRDARLATSVVEEGTLEVGRYAELAADLVPRTSHGRFAGRHRVRLVNRGNAPTTVRLSGSDDEQALDLQFAPAAITVPPGATVSAGVRARRRSLSLTGASRQWSFRVAAEAADTPAAALQGVMEQRPLLGRWTLRTLAVATIAAVGLAVYSAKGPELKSELSTVLRGSRSAQTGTVSGGGAGAGSSPAASSVPGGGAASPSPGPTSTPGGGTGTSGGTAGGTGTSGGTAGGSTGGSGSSTGPAPAPPATVIGSSSVAPGSFGSVRVLCPAGTQAVSGGIDPGNVLTVKVTESAPVYADNNHLLIFRSDGPNPAAVGWQVSGRNDDPAAQTIRAAVVCAGAFIGSTSTVVSTSNVFGAGNFSIASATCPAGAVALGGGIDLDNVLTMAVTSSGPTFGGTRLLSTANGRHPAPNGWQGSARNDSATPMKFKVAVICSTAVAARTSAMVAGTSFASPGNFTNARILCPSGAATVGGGVDDNNVLRMTVTSSAPVFPGANARTLTRSDGPDQAPNGWQVTARNDDSVAEPSAIAVICTTP